MNKIYLFGSSGKMGQAIQEVFREKAEYRTSFELRPLTRNDRLAELALGANDIVIDYSLPEGLAEVLSVLEKKSFKLVSGTTGLSPELKDRLHRLSARRAIFWAPNTSIGVEAFKRMVSQFHILPDFKFLISETHHVQKKDRPSGTALALKETLEHAIGRTVSEPKSIREGDVLGIHVVTATGEFEVIELSHRATSRQAFAEGALKVAKWMQTQSQGFFQMKDLTETS